MTATDTAISVTEWIGKVASFGEQALPVANLIAGILPFGGTVVSAIQIALPIIHKIAVGAPIAAKAINAGRPIFDALASAGPQMLPHLKELYAVAVNHDPARPETDLKASGVSDQEAISFAGLALLGRPWTREEEDRHFKNVHNIDNT